jgi:hypothetical protein
MAIEAENQITNQPENQSTNYQINLPTKWGGDQLYPPRNWSRPFLPIARKLFKRKKTFFN